MKTLLVKLVQFGQLSGTMVLTIAAIIALFGFMTPLLDAFNHLQPIWFFGTLISLILCWVLYKKSAYRTLLSSIGFAGLIASSLSVVPEAIGAISTPNTLSTPASAKTYKLLTHNIFARNADMAHEFSSIVAQSPDFVTLQEYFPYQRRHLHPMLVEEFPHFAICVGQKRGNLGLYSRHPFSPDREVTCDWDPDRRVARILARFTPDDAPAFSVMTTHLDWPVQVNPLFKDLPVRERFALTTMRQTNQFIDLSAAVQEVDGPVILTGDFNSTSWSYALRKFTSASGLTRHTKNLATFPRSLYIFGWRNTPAFLPLDHVMTKDGILVHDVDTIADTKSDHSPVLATFSVVVRP